MMIRSGARTHVGLVRTSNEDSFVCDDALGLYAVADGIGGNAGGEVASRMAIDTLRRSAVYPGWQAHLGSTFSSAHRAIVAGGKANPRRYGMGTTLTALGVEGGRLVVAHVGDSRCYRIRDGAGAQLTTDHIHMQHMLSNCLGCTLDSHESTEIHSEPMQAGDRFVLLSDGLGDYVDANEAARILGLLQGQPQAGTAQGLADLLVAAALKAGGGDNVTVVVVAVEP